MNTNVSLAAPIGVLTLLGTGFLLFVGSVVLIQSLFVRKRVRAKVILVVMLAIAAEHLSQTRSVRPSRTQPISLLIYRPTPKHEAC